MKTVSRNFSSAMGRMPVSRYTISYLVSVALFFGGCRTTDRQERHHITYWSSNNGGEIAFAKWACDNYNRKHPVSKVVFQPIPEGQSSEEILLAAVVAGTTPDIYSNIWQGLVDFYSQSGVLVALDTLDGFMDYLNERCDEATIQEITATDGHIYQVPWKINPIMTVYNKRLLRTLGYDSFPSSYGAYLSAAAKGSTDKNNDGYIDQWIGTTSVKLTWYQRLFNFYPLYLAASGGKPLIRDGKAAFHNKEAIEVFRFLQTLYARNYFSLQTESSGQDPFIGGSVASKWTGPWEVEYLEKFAPDDMEIGFAPMPVPDGHTGPVYTYCDPKSIVVFATCPDPGKAFEFIRWMTSADSDLSLLQTTRQLPRRKDLATYAGFTEFFQSHPKLKEFANQARYVKGADHSASMIEVFDILSQEYEACVLYQRKSPEQAIADAEKAVNILLRSSQKKPHD